MTTHSETGAGFALDRRAFLMGTAGLTFIIGAGGLVAACDRAAELIDFDPGIWLTIRSDGTILILAPAAEMGQGSLTALPLILAEELDANWDDVTVEPVEVHDKAYGNPVFGNLLYTGGSTAVRAYYPILRKAGAQARKILMQAAANHWTVPVGDLETAPSTVLHKESGRTLTYGEIAAFAKAPAGLPEIGEEDYRSPADFRLIGHDQPRLDVPAKARGEARYAMDVQVPGMVYAAIVHAPVEGQKVVSVDDAESRRTDGVIDVIPMGEFVAVIGDTVEATRFGKDVLAITWSQGAAGENFSSDRDMSDYSAMANDLARKGTPWRAQGDVAAAFDSAAKVVQAEYQCDYTYHAQMEPLNATARVNEAGDGAEIWTGTQSQSLTILTAAKVLGTGIDKITLHQMLLGGGFGRRAELKPTYVIEALLLSKRLKKPVKVIWSREDDVQNGWFRPTVAQVMRAGFDADGNMTAWNHRVAGPSVLEFYNTVRWSQTKGRDVISMLGTEIANYAVPNILAEHVIANRRARLAPWRGVATGYTLFAVESFVDELAREENIDPIEMRLRLLRGAPRGQHVIRTVAEMAGWGRKMPEGRALGIGFGGYHTSVTAGIAEISVDAKSGRIRVHKFWAAADPGLAVQPFNVEAQIESAIVYGISHALTERITIEDGEVQQSNFHDYIVMRQMDMPDIEIKVISTDNPPSSVGELGLPMTGGAIANALEALTGKRLRKLPMTPERVLEVLRS